MHRSTDWEVAAHGKIIQKMGMRLGLLLGLLLLAACTGVETLPATTAADTGDVTAPEAANLDETLDTMLPTLAPLTFEPDARVQVIASTSIIADIVKRVGADRVEVTTLMPPDTDPHSYTVTPQDLRLLNDADVIFVNGLGLEESLLSLLSNLDRPVPVVGVNVGVATADTDDDHADEHADEHEDGHAHEDEHADEHADDHAHEDDHADEHADDHAHEDEHEDDHADEHAHEDDHADEHEDDHAHDHAHLGADPHTWQSVENVQIWVENIHTVLSALDPDHARVYGENANRYAAELDALDAEIREQVAALPADARKLVTDHETYNYYARAYGFETIGAVIPSLSTLAAPSAQELAALQDAVTARGVTAIFVGTTVNPALAQQLSEDLAIQVVRLYSDSLSGPEGPAATYVDFMRHNTAAIVDALTE